MSGQIYTLEWELWRQAGDEQTVTETRQKVTLLTEARVGQGLRAAVAKTGRRGK